MSTINNQNNIKKPIGFFIEDEIYFQGKKQPLRKTEIIDLDTGVFKLSEKNENDLIKVLDVNYNWYCIKKKELTIY